MVVKIGIDTGGTYTDAVLFDDEKGVLSDAKSLTTRHNLSIGIKEVLTSVLSAVQDRPARDVALVSLSTTLATNAIVESMGFPVGLILIGHDRKVAHRADIKTALGKDPVLFVNGGHNAQGEEQAALDEAAILDGLAALEDKVSAFAVSGFFGLRNPAHEQRAREIIRQKTGLPVSCAFELSARLDAPRRALTALLNARLIPLIQHLVQSVEQIMTASGIDAPLMIVKGDGSLITSKTALKKPVETILSGPAASIVGAQFLCDQSDMTVCDMGGTTTDIAVVRNSRVQLASDGVVINGFQTMVEAVDVHTTGLGGDSEVRLDRDHNLVLGPRRNIPLSLLAMGHEDFVLSSLRRQQRRSHSKIRDGQFAVAAMAMTAALENRLSRSERAIMDRLHAGPVTLDELFAKSPSARALDRLIDSALVIISGFTPTDAAHILGLQDHWHHEAAHIGAALWAAKETANGKRWAESGDDLAKSVYDLVSLQTGEAIIEASLPKDVLGSVPLAAQPAPLKKLIRSSLQTNDANLPVAVNFSARLQNPIVGIGAPAATYYPDVAKRLGTSAILPRFAPVCNAIGAVVGEISQKVQVTVTQPKEGRFRVHGPNGNSDFDLLEQAVDEAGVLARQAAGASAAAAGADHIQFEQSRADQQVDMGGGTTLFLESCVTVTAHGRPRLA